VGDKGLKRAGARFSPSIQRMPNAGRPYRHKGVIADIPLTWNSGDVRLRALILERAVPQRSCAQSSPMPESPGPKATTPRRRSRRRHQANRLKTRARRRSRSRFPEPASRRFLANCPEGEGILELHSQPWIRALCTDRSTTRVLRSLRNSGGQSSPGRIVIGDSVSAGLLTRLLLVITRLY
jgi:hypothetical protein